MRLILHLRCASSASAPERTAAMRELQMRCASSAHNLLSTTVNCVVFLRRRRAAHEAHASCATLSPKHLGGTVEWEGVGKTPGSYVALETTILGSALITATPKQQHRTLCSTEHGRVDVRTGLGELALEAGHADGGLSGIANPVCQRCAAGSLANLLLTTPLLARWTYVTCIVLETPSYLGRWIQVRCLLPPSSSRARRVWRRSQGSRADPTVALPCEAGEQRRAATQRSKLDAWHL